MGKKNPSFGKWLVDWDDKVSVSESMGVPEEPGRKHFREDDTAQAFFDIEEDDILTAIEYKIVDKGLYDKGKRIFEVVLLFKSMSMSCVITSKTHPTLKGVLKILLRNYAEARLSYYNWLGFKNLGNNKKSKERYKNTKKNASKIVQLFGEGNVECLIDISEYF